MKKITLIFILCSFVAVGQKIPYTVNNGLQIQGVDASNSLIWDNDIAQDSPEVYWLFLKANKGQLNLKGVINTRDAYYLIDPNNPHATLAYTFPVFQEYYNAAIATGMKNIPAPVRGAEQPPSKPSNGNIDQAVYNNSAGADLIISEARKCTAAKPLVILVGGNCTTIANAYLKDKTIGDKIVVMHAYGYTNGSSYNQIDGWSTYIVMKRLRYITWAIGWPNMQLNLSGIPNNQFASKVMGYYNNNFSRYPTYGDAAPALYFFDHSAWTNVQRKTENYQVTTSDTFDYLQVSSNDNSKYQPALGNFLRDPNSYIPNTTPPPINSLPIVSLTNGTMFESGTITLTANASDVDGTVTKVEFFNGINNKIGEDQTAPYSVLFNVPAGIYQISARATDNQNGVGNSQIVTITVTDSSPPPDSTGCVTCPPGLQGPIGPQGPAGIQGPPGPQGPAGSGSGGVSIANTFVVQSAGTGSGDDTQAFQNAFNSAIATSGKVIIPAPQNFYILTNTINITPTAGQVWCQVEMQGRAGAIRFRGGSNKPVFKMRSIKGTVWEGLRVSIESGLTGVQIFDIDTDPQNQSSSFFTFKAFYLDLGNQPNNVGVRMGHLSQGGADISNIQFENCTVFGNGSPGQIAYQVEGTNTLSQTWIGGFTAFCDRIFSNKSGAGATSNRGNGSVFFYGMGGSNNNIDYEIAWEQEYLIIGGRYEAGKQKFLQVIEGGYSSITVQNVTIHDYAPAGNLIEAKVACSLTLSNISIAKTFGGLYTNPISLTAGNRNGSFWMQGCSISSDTPYIKTGGAQWDVTSIGNVKLTGVWSNGFFTNEIGIKK